MDEVPVADHDKAPLDCATRCPVDEVQTVLTNHQLLQSLTAIFPFKEYMKKDFGEMGKKTVYVRSNSAVALYFWRGRVNCSRCNH